MNIALSQSSPRPHVFRLYKLTLALFFIFAIIPWHVNAQTTATSLDVSTIVALTNTNRAAHGADALTESTLLDAAAQKKANDMVTNSYFSHYSPLGVSPWYWFTSVGYYYLHAGENLASNFDDSASLEAAWTASPLHQANIVKILYTQTGVGIAHGTYQGKPTTFVVQFFATPRDTMAVTHIHSSSLAANL